MCRNPYAGLTAGMQRFPLQPETLVLLHNHSHPVVGQLGRLHGLFPTPLHQTGQYSPKEEAGDLVVTEDAACGSGIGDIGMPLLLTTTPTSQSSWLQLKIRATDQFARMYLDLK